MSEVRWNGQGEHTTVSRDQDQAHESGVGLLLSKDAKKALLSWQPISDRIITARCNTKFSKISFVQCHAPTEVAAVDEKQQFNLREDGR